MLKRTSSWSTGPAVNKRVGLHAALLLLQRALSQGRLAGRNVVDGGRRKQLRQWDKVARRERENQLSCKQACHSQNQDQALGDQQQPAMCSN